MNQSILLMKCVKSESNKISVFSEKKQCKTWFWTIEFTKIRFSQDCVGGFQIFCIFIFSVKRQLQRYPYHWDVPIFFHYYDFWLRLRIPEFVKIDFLTIALSDFNNFYIFVIGTLRRIEPYSYYMGFSDSNMPYQGSSKNRTSLITLELIKIFHWIQLLPSTFLCLLRW